MAEKHNTSELYYNLMNPGLVMRETLLGFGITEIDFRRIHELISLPMSMFKYKGLEKVVKGVTSTILETALMFKSHLCFVNAEGLGWCLGTYTCSDTFDINGVPEKVNVNALNGSQIASNIPYKDIIIIKDNMLDVAPILPLIEYIESVKYIEKCLAIVTNNASLPLAMTGDKKTMEAMKLIAKKIGVKDPYVFGNGNALNNVQGFNIPIPVSPLDFFDLMKKYENKALSSFGIYSVEEKRERIVTQELVNQNDYTDFVYQERKSCRAEAIEELNKRANASIELIETYDINFNEGVEEKAKQVEATTKAQGEAIKEVDPSATFSTGNLTNLGKKNA